MTDTEPDDSSKSIDYDSASKVYDQLRSGNPEMMHEVLKGASIPDGGVVLDIGCGTCNNTLLFMKASRTRVVGIDLSRGMLNKACEKGPAPHLIQSSADRLPFKTCSFDFAYMTEVLHHVRDFRATIASAGRALRNHGQLCVVTQSHEQIDKRITSRFFPSTAGIDKSRYPSIKEIEGTMLDNHFVKVRNDTHEFATEDLGAEYLETIEQRAYSMLHMISEKEFQEGLARLREVIHSDEPLIYTPRYTFVWGIKGDLVGGVGTEVYSIAQQIS
ncbi:class I SAM-dependent methyltransferase [Candidatus Thorarchaeota archaeon]|nr:MAG: class I SAM-dependent methyltransferase [Candidatus Thorarchaeota archaeon]